MTEIPQWARKSKHAVFSILPGRVGLRNRACLHHLTKQSLEKEFTTALGKVKKGDLLIDCGANVGSVTRRFAATGATVHAFEPDPWSFSRLSDDLSCRENVTLHNCAIGTEQGTISFFRDTDFMDRPDYSSLASSAFRRPEKSQQEIKVDVIDFIEFVRELPQQVSILKMDVEGAEVAVLERLFANDLIGKFDHIFCETHELQFPDLLERTWELRSQAEHTKETALYLDWH